MYMFYIDDILLPITPSSLEISINSRNETIDLMNDGEINLLKSPGLTEISFEFMVPTVTAYPFQIAGIVPDRSYYTGILENLKINKRYFTFTVFRTDPAGNSLFNTTIDVSLEDFTVTEDAENGFDIVYKVNLKQYKHYGTKTLTISQSEEGTTATVDSNRETDKTDNDVPASYTIQKGDSLWKICKKYFNDGSKYKEIAEINSLKNPNLIREGQVIKLK